MNNCILVSDLSSDVDKDKLEIHFQRRNNGGNGDVKSIKILENKTKAIVEFEDEKTVASVLQHVHHINGRKLKVEKYENESSDKLFLKVEAFMCSHVEKSLGIETLLNVVEKYDKMEIKEQNGRYAVTTDSLDKLHKFEQELKSEIKKKKRNKKPNQLGTQLKAHSQQGNQGLLQNSSVAADSFGNNNRPSSSHSGPVRHASPQQPDSMLPEWSNVPFPQPNNGITAWQIVDDKIIKRKFCFPAGDVAVFNDSILYSSYDRTVCLPATGVGKEINEMLEDAFHKRKLFYIGRDTTSQGFKIQSAYDIFGSSNQDGEVNLTNKLAEIKTRLFDLGIPIPEVKKNHIQVPEQQTSTSGNKTQPRLRPFPQPDGLKFTSEYHDKSLPTFPNCGAIHMYFRFPGGIIDSEGQSIHYASYNRSACLPATDAGRKLFGMITEAANRKKLFVVAWKGGEYMVRTKVLLLLTEEYPKEGYLDTLYISLLKLGIKEPTKPVLLPKKVDAHYEEPSDDESDKAALEMLRKGGPFQQPEKGVINMEKDDKNLPGFGSCGTINIYFRFAGGKMKIEGNKPSKSFEVQYSQMMESTALPGSDNGRKLAIMLRTAFNDRKLFKVEKREGEPSFRVRPRVTFLTVADYPKNGYLDRLKNELLGLGIREPSMGAVNSLVIPKSTTPQGGALPASWPAPNTQPAPQPNLKPSLQTFPRASSNGARPKVLPSPYARTNGDVRPAFLQSPPVSPKTKKIFGVPSSVEKKTGIYRPPSSVIAPDSSLHNNEDEEEKCAVCLAPLSSMTNKTLPCKHTFHEQCVNMAISSQKTPFCPFCKQPISGNGATQPAASPRQTTAFGSNPPTLTPMFGNPIVQPFPRRNNRRNAQLGQRSNQLPNATMNYVTDPRSLPGYPGYQTIVIRYSIPRGKQGSHHPNPGAYYDGTNREAYLPDTAEGRDLLKLLEDAFYAGHTFTVGRSQSSGMDNQIIWNGIPHKTNISGGSHSYGYPDPNYMTELRRALASKGIR